MKDITKQNIVLEKIDNLGGSPGLEGMGGDLCSNGCEFAYPAPGTTFTLVCSKNVCLFQKDRRYLKTRQGMANLEKEIGCQLFNET